MTSIAFIGLGHMGAGMAANLAKAGHKVLAFDLSAAALDRAVGAGCVRAASTAEAVAAADVVITRTLTGRPVRSSAARRSSSAFCPRTVSLSVTFVGGQFLG